MLKAITNIINASQIATPITLPGDVTLSTGNLIQGTAAKGINFTANSALPGMTSELLNWYEEGTFTPTAAGITGTNTYAGSYTRVGNRVMWEILVTTTTAIGMTSGGSTLTPPFTPNQYGTCVAAEATTGGGYGTGLVNTTLIYPPTIAAGTIVIITGSYRVA
jgi:hypothetical protein